MSATSAHVVGRGSGDDAAGLHAQLARACRPDPIASSGMTRVRGRRGRKRRNSSAVATARRCLVDEGQRGKSGRAFDTRGASGAAIRGSGPLRTDSTTRRRGDPERGVALQFNRFRNSYGTSWVRVNITLKQYIRKCSNLCVE